MNPRFGTIDGLKVRLADSGDGQDRTLLLTSPWPESVYAFAPMWAMLVEHARLFAVDLPGFGASERRDDLLSPRAMGGFLARLIAEADLGRPHVVAPDVGTSAALFAAAAHPERIASVTVGTGGAAVPLELGEPLRSWVLDPDLDKYRKIDPGMIVDTAVGTIAGGIADEAHADYRACYAGDRFVESMRYARRYPEELPALAELYHQRWTIETNFRHLKITLGMDQLHCQTVAGVQKEMAMFCLVYNLVRLTMGLAAQAQRVPIERISFKDALRWLLTAGDRDQRLCLIVNPYRPWRFEPRVRKRRPKKYPLLHQPRRKLRNSLIQNQLGLN